MKTQIIDGQVTAISETKAEAHALIALALGGSVGEVARVQIHKNRAHGIIQKKTKHKPHVFRKACRYCHEEFRGERGRNIHEARKHRADAVITSVRAEVA